ncbi:flagellin [Rosenbergiella nectarea]|uniref:flagellin N-terminal helical domain-containing protein n=1 Tax=Rosenbergiella nectarea TaxID=988801 RepID=UPI001BDA4A6E|nr:flagellin [Rosenbergiella nectarea]MBT0729482.1 flagellin FliC [Rosenbergiella nectarea subsp. apis]
MAVINTNIMSLTTQTNLAKSQSALGTAIERLSTGKRINSAKDDAAGSAIANRMSSNIRGLTQASRNATDGISLAQTAEGALNEMNANLQRIRELTVQAKNGTNSAEDVKSIQAEVDARLSEITRIGNATTFNNIQLFDSDQTINIQVGANDDAAANVISISLSDDGFKSSELGAAFSVSGDGSGNADASLAEIDKRIAAVDSARSGLGAIQNRFQSTINNLDTTVNNLSASQSRVQDADYSTEVSSMSRAQILQQAGTSVLAKANQVPQTVLTLLQG